MHYKVVVFGVNGMTKYRFLYIMKNAVFISDELPR